MNKYKDQLESAYNEYIDKIEKIAESARQEYLIPYLKKHNYEFIAGNGTWLISDPTRFNLIKSSGISTWHDTSWDKTDKIPDYLDQILRLEILGSWGNSELALWMTDYKIGKD